MIKELAASIGAYKKDSLLAPAFVVLEVVMEVLIPLLMAKLIDLGINEGDMSYIWKMGMILVLCAFLSLVFGALSGLYCARGSAGFAKNLRRDVYYAVQDFSFTNIDHFSPASLITRLTTDITNVQYAYMMIIRIAVRSPVMLILALVFAMQVNLRLSLIFMAALPLLGIGLYFIISKAYPLFTKMFKTYDRLNNVVQENLRAIRVVKSYVREDYETKKFTDTSKELFHYATKAEKIVAFNYPLMNLVVCLCMLLIAWFGAKLIVVGEMTTGNLVSMISYTMQILMSLMMLSMVFVMITMARASAFRIAEVLKEKPDIVNPETPIYQVKDGSIFLQNVSFRYRKDADCDCLKDMNLAIASGETVGIIGGTGSGKSTLVQLIPRLYDVSKGELNVGGENVKRYDLQTLRDNVAMVLQNNVLFAGTIKENLRWGKKDATDEEIKAACRLAAADQFIESFPDGYDTYIEQDGANVSGGQKQRLCIARALLKQPKILILDDSTSAVDTATDARIQKALKTYLPETTKIVIAQRIASVENADKIIVMDNGVITDIGNHQSLLASSTIYQEVAASQRKGGDIDA